MGTIGAIAIGGALGAMARHGVNSVALNIVGAGFPWGTLLVNILGSFLIGFAVTFFDSLLEPSEMIRRMLITGFFGAFTTFSTFSLDVVSLWERGEMMAAAGYLCASVILSIGALLLAMAGARMVFS